ncbi:hypothetical protein ACS0TY_031215 [Phlomoides rotata]
MAAKQLDTNRAISNAGKGKELENEIENESEIDVDGSESHVDGDGGEVGFASSSKALHFRPIPPFLQKLYDILKDDEFNDIASWSCTGTSFVIKNVHSFAANVLPMYFKHNNFQSFMSQLNSYGFKKISWEKWEYKNEYFRKGERNLLKNIKRKDHCSRRILPSLDSKSSCSVNMENGLTILMKEHQQVKAEIMKLKEKQQILDEKVVSLGNQAASNKEDRKRMMLVAKRILKKQRGPSNAGVSMSEESRETSLKGKRKLEMEPTSTQDNEEKVVLDEEEMEMHHSNTFISLEDLFGKEYVKDVLEKASNHKFGLG